jgi:hypothetical protein
MQATLTRLMSITRMNMVVQSIMRSVEDDWRTLLSFRARTILQPHRTVSRVLPEATLAVAQPVARLSLGSSSRRGISQLQISSSLPFSTPSSPLQTSTYPTALRHNQHGRNKLSTTGGPVRSRWRRRMGWISGQHILVSTYRSY